MNQFLDSWEEKGDRIIVFAGVFDPVHKGHIHVAKQSRLRNNTILFIPERKPLHKKQATPYEHRLRMLHIAVATEQNMEVLDYPEPHHYVKPFFTWLQKRYPGREFSWLVGSDVLPLIESWEDVRSLASCGVREIIVASRDDTPTLFPLKSIHGVPVRKLMGRDSRKFAHISSRWVREDMRHRHTALPSGVYDYIRQNNLY